MSPFALYSSLEREMSRAMSNAALDVLRKFNDAGELPLHRKEMVEMMQRVLKEIFSTYSADWYVPDDYNRARKRKPTA
jgi:hypothetical protein